MARRTVLKPLHILMVEPILFLISLFISFIYGILYLLLEGVPIIFEGYNWRGGTTFLPYLGMLVGALVALFMHVFMFESIFVKHLAASREPVLPEGRLPPMMLSGIVFPMGIFLLCWAGAYRVMWFVPTVGTVFIGFGLQGIFVAGFNYIIDTYVVHAASAAAANTFLRSGFAAGFPLFAHPMFVNLGPQWAGTILGCLAVLLTPVPFLFYLLGRRIRRTSRYAFDLSVDVVAQKATTTNNLSPLTPQPPLREDNNPIMGCEDGKS